MIFTEIDKRTMQTLCTLLKIAEPKGDRKAAIVDVGQNLGVPKDDVLELMNDWDEADTLEFGNEKEKKEFVQFCFSHMESSDHTEKSERELYNYVVDSLGLKRISDN